MILRCSPVSGQGDGVEGAVEGSGGARWCGGLGRGLPHGQRALYG